MVEKNTHRQALKAMAVSAVALVLSASPSLAHPHAWIDAATELQLNDRQELTALTIHWQFDPAYSSFATEGLDKDGDGQISPAELKPLAAQNVKALKDYRYFTEIDVDGKQVDFGEVTDFSSDFNGLQLSMTFTVPLASPVYVKTHAITYSLYDPTYYVEILHREDHPISFTGHKVDGCSAELEKPNLEAAMSSLPYLTNEQTFAEDAPGPLSYGAMFAEKVHLICN